MKLRFRTVETSKGHVGFVASSRGVRRVYLPFRSAGSLKRAIREGAAAAVEDPVLMPDFADALKRYFAGELVEFSVRLDSATARPVPTSSWPSASGGPAGRAPSAWRWAAILVRLSCPVIAW